MDEARKQEEASMEGSIQENQKPPLMGIDEKSSYGPLEEHELFEDQTYDEDLKE
jgi:hypothetical protein